MKWFFDSRKYIEIDDVDVCWGVMNDLILGHKDLENWKGNNNVKQK
jgi:hypothetical protein